MLSTLACFNAVYPSLSLLTCWSLTLVATGSTAVTAVTAVT